jgi:hypothetical protein
MHNSQVHISVRDLLQFGPCLPSTLLCRIMLSGHDPSACLVQYFFTSFVISNRKSHVQAVNPPSSSIFYSTFLLPLTVSSHSSPHALIVVVGRRCPFTLAPRVAPSSSAASLSLTSPRVRFIALSVSAQRLFSPRRVRDCVFRKNEASYLTLPALPREKAHDAGPPQWSGRWFHTWGRSCSYAHRSVLDLGH